MHAIACGDIVAKNGRIITQKELGSCHGNMEKNTRKKRRHTIQTIIRGK